MAITLTSDPIMALDDAMTLLSITDEPVAKMIVNSLTEKFKRFTGRVQLSASDTAIIEHLRSPVCDTLFLHASPLKADTDITLDIWDGAASIEQYTLDEKDFRAYSDNFESRLESNGLFPVDGDVYIGKVTYKAGWSAIPGDVLEGAILQGRVDLNRFNGEIGITERSVGGESTTFETQGLAKAVRDLWAPYRMVI